MNIYSIFEQAAAKNPHQIAIIEGEKQITFAELRREIEAAAAQFLKKGIRPGDRLLVFVPMSIDLYRTVLAIFKIGATAVFLDEWVSWQRLNLCCELAECRGFVAPLKFRLLAWLSAPLRRIPLKFSSKPALPVEQSPATFQIAADLPALITFTTGSTGTPKAALRSHNFLKEQFDALSEEIQPRAGDVDMTVLPIVLLVNLGAGATSVIAKFKASKPDLLDAAAIFQQIEKHQVNRLTASPFFVRRLAENVVEVSNLDDVGRVTSSLRQIFTGGAPVFPAEAKILKNAFPKAEVKIAYGSTEAEPISLVAAKDLAKLADQKFLAGGLPVGKTYRKAEVKIIQIRDEAIELAENQKLESLPTGEVGEIVVAGPHVLASYFKNEEALRRNKIFESLPQSLQKEGRLQKIWHRTGDSGFLDAAGNLFLTGRCSTLFFQKGKLVCPFLVENFLQNLAGVAMGTVLKTADGRVVFFIETLKSVDRREISARVGECGVEFDELRFLEKMPRDPRHHSKIDYSKLISEL